MVGGIILLVSTGEVGQRHFSGVGVEQPISVEMQKGIEQLKLELNLGAGEATVQANTSNDLLVDGAFITDSNLSVTPTATVQGSTASVVIAQEGPEDFVWPRNGNFFGEMNLSLAEDIPLDLVVNSGASSLELDLSELIVNSVDINVGMTDVTLILPDSGDMTVTLDSGMSNVEIIVPSELEASISFDGAFYNIDPPSRFEHLDSGKYQTAHYAGASNRVTIIVSGAFGNLDVITR